MMATVSANSSQGTADEKQFEELGRFVQAFEAMVSNIRSACVDLVRVGATGGYPSSVNLIFHQNAFTAGPLFGTMRVLYGHLTRDIKTVSDADATIVDGVLKQCANEFEKLLSARNDLLHASWSMGGPASPNAEALRVLKVQPRAKGFTMAELPPDIVALRALRDRCAKLSELIAALRWGYPLGVVPLAHAVKWVDGKWMPNPSVDLHVAT